MEKGGVGRDPINPVQLLDMISSAPHKQLIVIDTNIALHQLGKCIFVYHFFVSITSNTLFL